MEKALEIAIMKGGYKNAPKKLNDEFDIWEYDHNAILLDPQFFQALGKAEGWYGTKCYDCAGHFDTPLFIENGDPCVRHVWHRFIDHLIAGKDADSFFKELLKN